MSVVEPGSGGGKLVARAANLIVRPKSTWDAIEAERPTIRGLYLGYVIPLAAIGPVAGFIGLAIFGAGAGLPGLGITIRFSPLWLAGQALVSFALSLVMVYVLALVIDGLAHSFGATKDRLQAFKVAAYAPTAAWLAGVFAILPQLGFVGIAGGIYSLVLLYWGLPRLMKAPEGRRAPYFAVVLTAAVVLNLLVVALASGVMTLGGSAARLSAPATVNVPGAGSVELGDLERAAKAAEAAARQIESGDGPAPTDPEILKSYLPANVGGFSLEGSKASTGGMGGLQGSGAEGAYARGETRMSLQVIDLGAAGALAGMAGAFNIKSSEETATGYEKIGKVGGRLTQEKYDRTARRGEYGVLIGGRFMVHAEGTGVSMDELKAAVGAVDAGRLEGLAKGG